MKDIKRGENHALDRKVAQLEKIMAHQIKRQKELNRHAEESLESSIRRAKLDMLEMENNDEAEDLLVRARSIRHKAQKYTRTGTEKSKRVTFKKDLGSISKHKTHRKKEDKSNKKSVHK